MHAPTVLNWLVVDLTIRNHTFSKLIIHIHVLIHHKHVDQWCTMDIWRFMTCTYFLLEFCSRTNKVLIWWELTSSNLELIHDTCYLIFQEMLWKPSILVNSVMSSPHWVFIYVYFISNMFCREKGSKE